MTMGNPCSDNGCEPQPNIQLKLQPVFKKKEKT